MRFHFGTCLWREGRRHGSTGRTHAPPRPAPTIFATVNLRGADAHLPVKRPTSRPSRRPPPGTKRETFKRRTKWPFPLRHRHGRLPDHDLHGRRGDDGLRSADREPQVGPPRRASRASSAPPSSRASSTRSAVNGGATASRRPSRARQGRRRSRTPKQEGN